MVGAVIRCDRAVLGHHWTFPLLSRVDILVVSFVRLYHVPYGTASLQKTVIGFCYIDSHCHYIYGRLPRPYFEMTVVRGNGTDLFS